MAINFCHSAFQPHVSTSAVTSDGYGVNNLCTASENIFQVKGFMVEYFIKPPIDITFEFPCNIQLDQIIIDPNLGSQKSCGFELFTKSVPMNMRDKWLIRSDEKVQNTTQHRRQGIPDVANPIGKAFFSDTGIRQVCFVNRQFRPRTPFQKSTEYSGQHATIVRELRHHYSQTLADVSHVVLRISCVFSGSVPALRKVEIYGQPARSCGREIESSILAIRASLIARSKPSTPDIIPTKRESADASSSSQNQYVTQSSANSIQEIPTDFADPITCEMMSLPVLLPSGHTIDQSTLDKHIATEANWGRKPNDPFTGVVFTDSIKPVPNVKLKARIDQFLLGADERLKMAPRTVGRASDLHNRGLKRTGSMKGDSYSGETRCSDSSTACDSSHSGHQISCQAKGSNSAGMDSTLSDHPSITGVRGDSTVNKKRKYRSVKSQRVANSVIVPSPRNKQMTGHLDLKSDRSTANTFEGGSNHAPKRPKLDELPKHHDDRAGGLKYLPTQAIDHEKRLAMSLDDALRNTLGTMRSFGRADQGPGSSQALESSVCSSCRLSIDSLNEGCPAYTLPCKHIVCRKCLLKTDASQGSMLNHVTCPKCKRSFPSNQITRTHAVS